MFVTNHQSSSSLKFTGDKEKNKTIPVLDTRIINNEEIFYLVFQILRYRIIEQQSFTLFTGFIGHVATYLFDKSIERAKNNLVKKQYPPAFTDR